MKHPGRISGGNLTLAGLVVVSIGVVPVNAASFKTNSIEGSRSRRYSAIHARVPADVSIWFLELTLNDS